MQGFSVSLGVHSNRLYTQFVASPNDAERNLSTVRNQDLPEQGCLAWLGRIHEEEYLAIFDWMGVLHADFDNGACYL